MRVAVLGATGTIGRVLALELAQASVEWIRARLPFALTPFETALREALAAREGG